MHYVIRLCVDDVGVGAIAAQDVGDALAGRVLDYVEARVRGESSGVAGAGKEARVRVGPAERIGFPGSQVHAIALRSI